MPDPTSQDNTTTAAAPTPATTGDATVVDPIIESASATTDHVNNKSGVAAYVIAGVVVAVLCLLTLSMTSCMSSILDAYEYDDAYGYGSGSSNGYGNSYGYGNNNGYGSYGSDSDSSSNSYGSSSSDTLTQGSVLSYDLMLYDYSITDEVAATSYSGAQASVADFSRAIVKIDKEANAKLVTHLRVAASATDDDTVASELAAANDVATQAKADIDALVVPSDSVEGSASTSARYIIGLLDDAQGDASSRWSSILTIISIQQDPAGRTMSTLESYDYYEDSYTTSCGQSLVSALEASASV
jgi:hypothetical protein